MNRKIKKQLIFKHVLDRTRGLVRLDDNDLESILDIALDDDTIWIDVTYYRANCTRGEDKISWDKIRTFQVKKEEIDRVLASIENPNITIGAYKYELPDRSIITNNVVLFKEL